MSAKITLYSDALQTVTADGVIKNLSSSGAGVYIFFEGDVEPRGFRGTAFSDVWTFQCLFAPTTVGHANAALLLSILEIAFKEADGRLRVDPGGRDAGVVWTVEVHDWVRQIRPVANFTSVEFTAQEVRG